MSQASSPPPDRPTRRPGPRGTGPVRVAKPSTIPIATQPAEDRNCQQGERRFAGEGDRGPGDTDCISLAGTENEPEASKVSPRIWVDWIVELQQLLDRTINTGQQRDLRAVPDSGLNSPGLEEETSDYYRSRDTVQVQ